MPKRKDQPEPHYIFDNPNEPEDVVKFLIKKCTEKLVQEVMKDYQLLAEATLKENKQ